MLSVLGSRWSGRGGI